MKNLKLLFSLTLLGVFLIGLSSDSTAQTVTLKRKAMAAGNLGSYPSGTFPIYSGLRTVAKGMKVYLTADTTGTPSPVTSFTWSFTAVPTGSVAAFSSTTDQSVTFVPDVTGQYIVSVAVNGGASSSDTLFASTYQGFGTTPLGCQSCHASTAAKWQNTGHANHFKNGITGQLSAANVDGLYMGRYGPTCIKCHTTGWDQTVDNNNFGYNAHQTGFDTTWYQGRTLAGYYYLIPFQDMSAWDTLTTDPKFASVAPLAYIGCESCHGPGADHVASFGNTAKISKSLDAGVCLQCHDAPTHHTIGTYYNASNHATLPNSGHANRTYCMPCHSGSAYVKYVDNPTSPDFDDSDVLTPISCAVCHDPHETDNNLGLRIASVTLQNGYSVTAGGRGQICMTCHQSRKNGNTIITDTPPYYGFVDRFGPHHGPQTDMLFGQNSYEFGNAKLAGLNTHAGLTDGCVTCHMAAIGPSSQPNHSWNMVDTTGGVTKDLVGACQTCHGASVQSFEDIKASSDFDGNGKIEGVEIEVKGMLDSLANHLPKDASGNVVYRLADSSKVKNQPEIIKAIWTYYFVSEDKSMGIHNAKYTVAILNEAFKALGVVIPVELTSFTSSVNNNAVTLKWETVTETNNKGFEIERKIGNDWSTIDFVAGKGNSTELAYYSFVDDVSRLNVSKVAYRLKQVDFNGTSKYSKVIEVELNQGPKDYALMQNYPNPFNPSTVIKYSLPYESKVRLVIYSITGQEVTELVNGVQAAGVHESTLNTTTKSEMQLSSGIYFYSLEATALDGSNSFRSTKKMILMK